MRSARAALSFSGIAAYATVSQDSPQLPSNRLNARNIYPLIFSFVYHDGVTLLVRTGRLAMPTHGTPGEPNDASLRTGFLAAPPGCHPLTLGRRLHVPPRGVNNPGQASRLRCAEASARCSSLGPYRWCGEKAE